MIQRDRCLQRRSVSSKFAEKGKVNIFIKVKALQVISQPSIKGIFWYIFPEKKLKPLNIIEMVFTKIMMKVASSQRQTRFLLLFFSTISLLLTSCKKKADVDPYYRLPADGLSFIQLRQGQYFIYKDSATQALDSVIVNESKLEKLHSNGSGQFRSSTDYDSYSLTLTKATATGNTVWLKGAAIAAFSNTGFSLLSSTGNAWDDYMFRYPVGDLLGIFPNDRSISALTVEGKQYTQIILTTGNGSTSSRFYWAKNVGLIRYERGGPASQTFTLLRNN